MGPRALSGTAAALIAALAGCGGDDRPAARSPATTTAAKPRSAPASPLCGRLRPQRLGTIRGGNVSELSGMARARDGRLFAIEDSGNSATLIALGRDGRVTGRPQVTGAQNVDWEDVSARGGDLFVADIGDNGSTRDAIQVYRVPAPGAGAAATAPARTVTLRYPSVPRDAEALLVDPLRDELLVVTKGPLDARVFRAPLSGGTMRRGPSLGMGFVTAGAISRDGLTIVLRSYDTLAVWRRHGHEPLTRTLAREPCVSPTSLAREGQGEALALDGPRAILTAPEGERPVLRRWHL
jgi:hypothetical protein